MTLRLQPLTRAKVATLGEAGRAWHEALPATLAVLAEQWEVELGRPLPGGSASYVCGAVTSGGEERVVKVALPGMALALEAGVLAAAGGRGYAVLHAHDVAREAVLLERLGPSLESAGAPVEDTLDVLAAVLLDAWTVPVATVAPATDRAAELRALVVATDDRLDHPCDARALRRALACADRRSAEHGRGREVVVHGDPHPGNALRVRAPRPGAEAGHVLVDPDGFRCDPAYDAGVVLRDWCSRLTGPDPRATLASYTRRLAGRTGLDVDAVADWAYLERVSTGLYVLSLGADRLGRRFLDSAAALA